MPVTVTYCPLTATVQGFKRGAVTFGVSGLLMMLGIQATAAVLTTFQVLLPAATVLLAPSLLYLGWHADAAVIGPSSLSGA